MNTVQEDRSWWEHWSSGVVLILLVIALVAASIMALSDTNQEQSQDLAGTEDEFSLDGLVHDLEGLDAAVMDDAVSESPQPAHGSSTKSNLMHSSVQGPQLADGQASGSAVVPQSSSPDDPRNQPPIDGLSADALPATAPVASSEADRSSATPGATAQASKSQNFQSGSPSSSIQNTGESLMVQVPESHLTQESVAKPSVSLSTPRPAEQAQPSTEQMMSHARNDQSIGLQPAGSAETSPLQQSTLAASAQQQSSVQLPAYQTPAGGVPHSTAEHSLGSHRLTTVSHRTPVDAPPESNSTPTAAAEQTQGGPMVKSATPEMDAEALIRAYQEFRQLNQVGAQTSNGHTSNSQN